MPTLDELREKLRAGEPAYDVYEAERNQMPGGDFQWKWWNDGNSWHFRCGDHVAMLHCAQVSSIEGGLRSRKARVIAITMKIFEDLGWDVAEGDDEIGDWWDPTVDLVETFLDRAPKQLEGPHPTPTDFKPSERLVETVKLEMKRRKKAKARKKKPRVPIRGVATLSARDKLVRAEGMLVRVDGHHLYKWSEKLNRWIHEGAR